MRTDGLRALLPRSVCVVEVSGDLPDALVWPGEESAVRGADAGRVAEFTTTRQCARLALRQLGCPDHGIPAGPDREPLWPSGVVGSLTHCDGVRAAAVACSVDVRAVGIDAEPHAVTEVGVLDVAASVSEIEMLDTLTASMSDVAWDRVLFSAKEAIFKAWFPLTRQWLGYTDCEFRIHAGTGTFTGQLPSTPECDGLYDGSVVHGRWTIHGGHVLTAVCIDT